MNESFNITSTFHLISLSDNLRKQPKATKNIRKWSMLWNDVMLNIEHFLVIMQFGSKLILKSNSDTVTIFTTLFRNWDEV